MMLIIHMQLILVTYFFRLGWFPRITMAAITEVWDTKQTNSGSSLESQATEEPTIA